MKALQELIDELRASFDGLPQSTQLMASASALFGLALLLVIGALLINGGAARSERRISQKTKQLKEVLALQGDYRKREAEQRQQRARLGRSSIRLVSVVDEAARASGVDVKEMKPRDEEADENGVVESRVELEARGMSVDRLQKFIGELVAKHPGAITIPKLKLSRPYRKDTLNLEMRVVTYKIEDRP